MGFFSSLLAHPSFWILAALLARSRLWVKNLSIPAQHGCSAHRAVLGFLSVVACAVRNCYRIK